MRVELVEKFNMSIGTVLLVKADNVLNVGERIYVDDKEYTIKGFMQPSGFYDDHRISVIV